MLTDSRELSEWQALAKIEVERKPEPRTDGKVMAKDMSKKKFGETLLSTLGAAKKVK